MSKHLVMTFFATLCCLSAVTLAPAAVVTFSPVGTIANSSNGEEVDNTLQYRFAWNAGPSGTTVTVNGVTFHGSPIGHPSGISITHDAPVQVTGRDDGASYGTAMSTLMDDDILSNDAEGATFNLSLNGLNVGDFYRVQFLIVDTNAPSSRDMLIKSGVPETQTPAFAAGNPGRHLFASFTADATTQAFLFQSQDINAILGDRAGLNGIAIFSIPEPTSAAVLALGGALLMLRRRRDENALGR